VYSVGVVLYHLASMQYPVEGQTVDEIAAAHARGEMTPLSDRRPNLPGSFVRVVERALEREPARRYRSSGAMQHDLVSALELDVLPTTRGVTARQRPNVPSMAVLP
jgi:serine/threonine-protein kinase